MTPIYSEKETPEVKNLKFGIAHKNEGGKNCENCKPRPGGIIRADDDLKRCADCGRKFNQVTHKNEGENIRDLALQQLMRLMPQQEQIVRREHVYALFCRLLDRAIQSWPVSRN